MVNILKANKSDYNINLQSLVHDYHIPVLLADKNSNITAVLGKNRLATFTLPVFLDGDSIYPATFVKGRNDFLNKFWNLSLARIDEGSHITRDCINPIDEGRNRSLITSFDANAVSPNISAFCRSITNTSVVLSP